MPGKMRTREELAKMVSVRHCGFKWVLTNGVYDLLHVGHIRLLQKAKTLGNYLVVALNSDASTRQLGKPDDRPLQPEAERAEILSALECVDAVTIFDEPDPRALILAIRPDVLVKGGDWKPENVIGREEVESWGGKVVIVPTVPGHSTTGIVERARGNGASDEKWMVEVRTLGPVACDCFNIEGSGPVTQSDKGTTWKDCDGGFRYFEGRNLVSVITRPIKGNCIRESLEVKK